VFHQVLSFEMGTGVVLGTGGVNDGQRAIVVNGREIFQQRIESEKVIERQGVAFADGNAWPGAVIAIVLQWRDYVQAISAAAQEDDEEGVAVIAVAGGVGLEGGGVSPHFFLPKRHPEKAQN